MSGTLPRQRSGDSPSRPSVAVLRARWVAACLAGEAAGLALAAAAMAVLGALVGEPASLAPALLVWAVMVAVGVAEGFVLGLLQARVLHHWLPALRVSRWAWATATLAGLGWAVGMLPSTLQALSPASPVAAAGPDVSGWVGIGALALGGAAAGALLGAVQAWSARGVAAGLGGWVAVNALGWMLAVAWVFAVAALPSPGWAGWAVTLCGVGAGVGSGLLGGLVTAYWLPRLRRIAAPARPAVPSVPLRMR